MPKSLRLPKTPIKTKTSTVRHDEHFERHVIDPACPICRVDIGTKSPEGVKEGYAVTPCGHVFGSVCIKKYLAITDKPLCPVCRMNLFHLCAHPVLPASYDPKKSRLSSEEAAAAAFPDEPRQTDCSFCRHRKTKMARRIRKRVMLERASRGGRASGSLVSASGSASASGSGEEDAEEEGDSDSESGGGSPSRGTKVMRLALQTIHYTAALARLTLDATRIRKIKVLAPEEQGNVRSGNGEEYNEDNDDEQDEGDIIMPDSPQLAANRHFPPVPGPYGHWDLANKGPDWKFLGWYDSQEPRMKTTPEQFS